LRRPGLIPKLGESDSSSAFTCLMSPLRTYPGLSRASRRNVGETSREGLTDLIAGPRLLDARLKAGQDALDRPADPTPSCTGLTRASRRDGGGISHEWSDRSHRRISRPGCPAQGRARRVGPPRRSHAVMHGLDPCIPARRRRGTARRPHRRISPPGCPAQGRARRVGPPRGSGAVMHGLNPCIPTRGGEVRHEGLIAGPRLLDARDGGEVRHEGLIAASRLPDARLKDGQDGLDRPAGPTPSCTGLTRASRRNGSQISHEWSD
jgi:hypothetical protein